LENRIADFDLKKNPFGPCDRGGTDHPLDFPGCYYSAGAFAEFFGRVAGEPVAVMEVECRSMGAERCLFLVGATEIMQRVYDAMGEGVAYDQAVAAGT